MANRVYSVPIVFGDWKPWFAWRPVRLGDGPAAKGALVWLRHIEKRWGWMVLFWTEYRLPPQPSSQSKD